MWTGHEGAIFIPREVYVPSWPPAVLQDLNGPQAGRTGAWERGRVSRARADPHPRAEATLSHPHHGATSLKVTSFQNYRIIYRNVESFISTIKGDPVCCHKNK